MGSFFRFCCAPTPRGHGSDDRLTAGVDVGLAEYLHEITVFPKGKYDDQADSTAQFLDWFKRPFPSQGIYEYYRRLAQAAEQHRKPQPTQTVWAVGSMEWLAAQRESS